MTIERVIAISIEDSIDKREKSILHIGKHRNAKGSPSALNASLEICNQTVGASWEP